MTSSLGPQLALQKVGYVSEKHGHLLVPVLYSLQKTANSLARTLVTVSLSDSRAYEAAQNTQGNCRKGHRTTEVSMTRGV